MKNRKPIKFIFTYNTVVETITNILEKVRPTCVLDSFLILQTVFILCTE